MSASSRPASGGDPSHADLRKKQPCNDRGLSQRGADVEIPYADRGARAAQLAQTSFGSTVITFIRRARRATLSGEMRVCFSPAISLSFIGKKVVTR